MDEWERGVPKKLSEARRLEEAIAQKIRGLNQLAKPLT